MWKQFADRQFNYRPNNIPDAGALRSLRVTEIGEEETRQERREERGPVEEFLIRSCFSFLRVHRALIVGESGWKIGGKWIMHFVFLDFWRPRPAAMNGGNVLDMIYMESNCRLWEESRRISFEGLDLLMRFVGFLLRCFCLETFR